MRKKLRDNTKSRNSLTGDITFAETNSHRLTTILTRAVIGQKAKKGIDMGYYRFTWSTKPPFSNKPVTR